MTHISISKDVLQKSGWYIYRDANKYDRDISNHKPYVVAYCFQCDAQRVLTYVGQKENMFIFECGFCTECEKSNSEAV